MKYFLAVLLLIVPAHAAVTTQPLSPTTPSLPANPSAPAPQQLTTLVSAAILRIEHLPASPDRDAKVAAIAASLKKTHVYGSVIVDTAAEGTLTAHLLWHDKPVLTADEQQQLDKAKADQAKAQATFNEQVASDNSMHAVAPQQTITDSGVPAARAALNEAIRTTNALTAQLNAAALARLPLQTVFLTTTDPLAAKLRPRAAYTLTGYITSAVPTTNQAGFVSFAITVGPMPDTAPPTTAPATSQKGD